MTTIQVSHADLAKAYLPSGRKTDAVNVKPLELTSCGRSITWITLRKNGLIDLSGANPVHGGKATTWRQTYRHSAPIDD